jgi:ornithine cyclodeaminase/alanine dehydrogenase-like protein (mu-crystallin family)
MSVPLRIGMIGAGFNARFHVESLISVREAELGGVMSRTRASAELLADYARELNIGDANEHETIDLRTADLSGFEPAVSLGTWRP